MLDDGKADSECLDGREQGQGEAKMGAERCFKCCVRKGGGRKGL